MGNMIAKCFNGIFLAKMKDILSLTVVENVEFFCQLFTLWCRVDWKLSVGMDRPGTFLREFLVLIAVTKNGRIIWQKQFRCYYQRLKRAFSCYISIHVIVFSTYMLFYPLHQLLEEENGIHYRTDLMPSQLPSVPLCGETDKSNAFCQQKKAKHDLPR